MKATLRNGKGSADHNDRNYENATQEKKEEVLMKWQCQPRSETFRENELWAYNYLFNDWLNQKNEKYKVSGHKEDVRTMEQILGGTNKNKTKSRFEPEETILQIGKNGEHIPFDVFKACVTDFLKEICKIYGENMQILDFAIHQEESSVCHCHLRRVWIAIDENGQKRPAKKEALKQLGYELPEGIKEDRYHNLSIIQTAEERSLWYDILRQHDINIDEIPDLDNAEHHTTKEYKRIIEANEKTIQAQEKTIQRNKSRIAETEEKMEELNKNWLGVGSIENPVKSNGQSLDALIGLAR